MIPFNKEELLQKSLEARSFSYAPYSGFSVGAALLSSSGKIYLGSNIENASYSATVCAERAAFFTGISAGEREFTAIAVAGGYIGEPPRDIVPCGVCRQVMAEFAGEDFIILLADGKGEYSEYKLNELLPHSFGKNNMMR